MRVLRIVFLLCICGIGLCSAEDDSFYPQRIISLGPALTEQLYLLGAEDRIVGVTTYCRAPEKEKIGTVLEVNLEKIAHLEPDIVLATGLTNAKTKEKLKDLGINVANFPQAKNFSQICAQFLKLGRIVGKEKKAEKIVRQAKSKLDIIKKKVKALPKQRVFVQIGAKPLFAASKDSLINDYIEFAGGKNCVSGTKIGLYSREKVLQDNPDVIIIIGMGIAGKEEKQIWQRYKTLKAVQNKRIHIVDSYRFCSPTPLSFVGALEEMVNILHPQDGPR